MTEQIKLEREQKKRKLEKQKRELVRILGREINTYAVPIQLRPPNSPDIPNPPNALSVPVTFSSNTYPPSYVPRFEAVLAGVQPPRDKVKCVLDTGASYHTIKQSTAKALSLSAQNGVVHTLPQVDILTSNPPLSLRNIKVQVDKHATDDLLLGIPLFDFFQTIIFDLGTSKNEGWIRFIPYL